MRLKAFTAAALTLWATTIADAQTATSTGRDRVQQLIRVAYFSDACRQAAEALGIARTSDPNTLFAALAGLGRRHPAPGADRPHAQRDDCAMPVVLSINVLRLNGVDAELVLASMTPSGAAADGAPSDVIDRILIYVAALDRYFDPAAPLAKQAVLDQIIRETAQRVHLLGPSLAGDARDACLDSCMHVYPPRRGPTVRVKTEVIRGR
jgi:hypothetical protein